MAFKVQVGPPQIAIHQGQTVLVIEEDGQISWPSDKGLYFLDTRIISSWSIYAAARIFLTNKSILTEEGTIPPRTLTISRSISGGVYAAPMRSESNFPVQYLGANVPQAWAVGSVFMTVFDVTKGDPNLVERCDIAKNG
jgi:hypothetical protein